MRCSFTFMLHRSLILTSLLSPLLHFTFLLTHMGCFFFFFLHFSNQAFSFFTKQQPLCFIVFFSLSFLFLEKKVECVTEIAEKEVQARDNVKSRWRYLYFFKPPLNALKTCLLFQFAIHFLNTLKKKSKCIKIN